MEDEIATDASSDARFCLIDNGGKLKLKTSHHYYYQVYKYQHSTLLFLNIEVPKGALSPEVTASVAVNVNLGGHIPSFRVIRCISLLSAYALLGAG